MKTTKGTLSASRQKTNPMTEWRLFLQLFAGLVLIVSAFPESISISSSSESEMTEGVESALICNISNIAPVKNLIVWWYKGDTIIHQKNISESTTINPTNLSPHHYFTPTRHDSNTTLRCDAYMDLGPEGPNFTASSQKYHTEVKYGPDIECSTIELHEGETLEGKCRVTGNPIPYVEWLKGGRLINSTIPLRRHDAGTFTVKAEGLTLKRTNIQVDVLYGPEWTCPHTYTILENSIHNVTCSLGFPEPEEIWFKDEEEVVLPQVLTRRNAGQYLVRVSNTLSSYNFTVDIIVLYPPSEIFELEDAEVNVGESLGLKCSSVSYPKPNYSWSYYQEANVMVQTEDGVSRLIIDRATGYNTGFYTCRVWTEQGSVSKTVRVHVKGAEQECPIEITPKEVVLQYQSRGQLVECESKTNKTNVKKIFWTLKSTNISNSSWFVNTSEDWDPQPSCHGNFTGIGICSKALPYILYKIPEKVSIRFVNASESFLEGTELQLKCDIIGVAPAQNLTVRWTFYRGNETVPPLGNASCDSSPNRSPLNVSCTMNITLERSHNGIEARCEAELSLGLTGPQPPNMTSNTLNIPVFYGPSINTTKLPETVLVFRDSPEELVCEADGNPPPTIDWEYNSQTATLKSDGHLVVYDAGSYKCNATNKFNSTIQEVKVILIEDYLPLIAGFVALTVVIISIVFLFIYSIYYKNTKMRRYSLKNPKFSSQNGNVAHNGWDIQLPVTKLS
ncbi:hemicentin-1-like isoform X2 [Kryptolebias marmoratus]|uniref:hemicentin-1-like isoform X2 n=1 Tax=Kryptolebias marmoratus TaxID=37003 RepID=UPI0007F93035|nr:hemicentin-1-like isoform X2 [Kryptolebias marmoratus]